LWAAPWVEGLGLDWLFRWALPQRGQGRCLLFCGMGIIKWYNQHLQLWLHIETLNTINQYLDITLQVRYDRKSSQ
jgi:hypothetical protein